MSFLIATFYFSHKLSQKRAIIIGNALYIAFQYRLYYIAPTSYKELDTELEAISKIILYEFFIIHPFHVKIFQSQKNLRQKIYKKTTFYYVFKKFK